MGAILPTLLLLQHSEEAPGPWSGHAQTRSKQLSQGGGGQETECFDGTACVRTGGWDEGAGAVWKPSCCLQGAPQRSWREPDQRAARGQRVTTPTASRSRWQPWGDWPGTECDILGVTGRHVGLGREQAGPRAHPSRLTARSISLKGQPSAQPSPAQNSSVAAHCPLNQGQNATALHSKSFPGWPQATSQTHLLPVPAQTLTLGSSQMDLLFCKQALQSAPHPHAFVHTISSPWECPSPTVRSSLHLPSKPADTESPFRHHIFLVLP